MGTVSNIGPGRPALAMRSSDEGDETVPYRPYVPSPRPRRPRRQPGLGTLTVLAAPISLAGMKVLLGEGGASISSDAVYLFIAFVTLVASGVVMTALGVLFFVLVDPGRTKRLVAIIRASGGRRRRR